MPQSSKDTTFASSRSPISTPKWSPITPLSTPSHDDRSITGLQMEKYGIDKKTVDTTRILPYTGPNSFGENYFPGQANFLIQAEQEPSPSLPCFVYFPEVIKHADLHTQPMSPEDDHLIERGQFSPFSRPASPSLEDLPGTTCAETAPPSRQARPLDRPARAQSPNGRVDEDDHRIEDHRQKCGGQKQRRKPRYIHIRGEMAATQHRTSIHRTNSDVSDMAGLCAGHTYSTLPPCSPWVLLFKYCSNNNECPTPPRQKPPTYLYP